MISDQIPPASPRDGRLGLNVQRLSSSPVVSGTKPMVLAKPVLDGLACAVGDDPTGSRFLA